MSQVSMARHTPSGQLVAIKHTNLDECTEEELLQLSVSAISFLHRRRVSDQACVALPWITLMPSGIKTSEMLVITSLCDLTSHDFKNSLELPKSAFLCKCSQIKDIRHTLHISNVRNDVTHFTEVCALQNCLFELREGHLCPT